MKLFTIIKNIIEWVAKAIWKFCEAILITILWFLIVRAMFF